MIGSDETFVSPFIRLWRQISNHRKRQFMALLLLMVVSSFAEVVSIGAVLPFLGMLTSPQRVLESQSLQPLMRILDIRSTEQFLLPATVMFGFAALVSGGIRLALLWCTTRLTFATGADISNEIYRRTLYQPYSVHVARNSSEVISGISSKANDVIFNAIFPVLTIISAGVTLVSILLAMLFIDPFVALTAFAGFASVYLVIVRFTRRALAQNSERISRESVQVIKSLQEGLGGIRDVLIDGTQPVYCEIYKSADLPLRRAQGGNQFLAIFPRYGIEALGMLVIAGLAYKMVQSASAGASAIPVLGALALGAQRMLPMLQQAYANFTAMRAGRASFKDALALLEQPMPEQVESSLLRPLSFNHAITFHDVSFRYSIDTPQVLKQIQLEIRKGERIGFMGTTGSGKSTLLDLLMGLLEPTSGVIRIDGAALATADLPGWRTHIAHVPQAIFLTDATIAENIAFGVPKEMIDMDRVRFAAAQAQLVETVERLPLGYATTVGERGIRLSGGQRQRIGIARALYKQADVIIFDEATSALDAETESAVMQAINGLGDNLTLLIIAHRLSTLAGCSRVVELSDGQMKRVGTFQQIAGLY